MLGVIFQLCGEAEKLKKSRDMQSQKKKNAQQKEIPPKNNTHMTNHHHLDYPREARALLSAATSTTQIEAVNHELVVYFSMSLFYVLACLMSLVFYLIMVEEWWREGVRLRAMKMDHKKLRLPK